MVSVGCSGEIVVAGNTSRAVTNPRPRKYSRHFDSFYINITRLLSRAKDDGATITLPRNGRFTELRQLDINELIDFRDQCEQYAASGAISAVRINRIADWARVRPGATISMAHHFSTNGIPDVITWPERKPLPTGELGHAYRDVGGWRFWMDIEPRWIVNSSGALMFRFGRGYLTGLATVKTIARADSIVYASPLILGL